MMEFIEMGGVMMWPTLLCTLLVVAMAVRATLTSDRGVPAIRALRRSAVDSVLFWGFAAAVLGVLGTLAGVVQMASAIERAGMVHTATVWGGMKVTLATSIAGVGTLLVALLLWMALRTFLIDGRLPEEPIS